MELIFEKQPIMTDQKMQENSGGKEERARYIMAQIRYPSWQKKEERGQNSNFTSNWQAISLKGSDGSNAATLWNFS